MSTKKFCCTNKMNLYEFCASCYDAYFSDPNFKVAWDEYDEYLLAPQINYSSLEAVCECGSEASGGTTHSHWCPKGSGK